MKAVQIKHTKNLNYLGDTIVEVLIAIAIAGFAIGISYSLANKSLQRAITARERNEAVNIVQTQLSALKYRFEKISLDQFNSGFAVPQSFIGPVSPATHSTAFSFCLHPDATGPADTAKWPRVDNHFGNNYVLANTLADTNQGGNYDPVCKNTLNGTDFFIDIEAQVTQASDGAINRTVYQANVRWPQIGGGSNNEATVYYRF